MTLKFQEFFLCYEALNSIYGSPCNRQDLELNVFNTAILRLNAEQLKKDLDLETFTVAFMEIFCVFDSMLKNQILSLLSNLFKPTWKRSLAGDHLH